MKLNREQNSCTTVRRSRESARQESADRDPLLFRDDILFLFQYGWQKPAGGVWHDPQQDGEDGGPSIKQQKGAIWRWEQHGNNTILKFWATRLFFSLTFRVITITLLSAVRETAQRDERECVSILAKNKKLEEDILKVRRSLAHSQTNLSSNLLLHRYLGEEMTKVEEERKQCLHQLVSWKN